MLSEQEAFVREIAADPDSDVPRLIYADWLEERGDPQGEFIRVQCELATTTELSRRSDLVARERALLAEHRNAWCAPLGSGLLQGRFHRGFLDQVEVEPAAFLRDANVWFRHFPLTTLQINLTSVTPHQFASIGELRQIRSLRLGYSGLTDARAIQVLSSPNIGPLRELWLSGNKIRYTFVRWLSASELASSLEVLILSGNPLDTRGRSVLESDLVLANLRRLYITQCGIDRESAERIQRRLPKLEGISYV